MTREERERLRALCAAYDDAHEAYNALDGEYDHELESAALVTLEQADAAFIAAAREAVPALLDEVDRLRGLLRDICERDLLRCICPPAGGCECGHWDVCNRIEEALR